MSLILVVDDTTLDRESVSKLLEYEGFQTVRACNGKEAYATLYRQTPDLVLLDLMMPEMDGVTFLRMVRRSPQWEHLPIIVLTGATDDDNLVVRARDFHPDGMVPKATFGFDHLLNCIKGAIGAKQTAAH